MKRFCHLLHAAVTLLACLVVCTFPISVAAKDFVVVIDAGHGGHDPGAIGKISKEKNINLKVALKLGSLIQKSCPDVKIVYTRKSDVFIPLMQRAQIANNAKADLFISIHTNALAKNKTVTGASTWTLGLAKSDENLEVAKRENSVILYEDDYKSRYAGFDPNSAESYIIFELMQDKYLSQSVQLASMVQKEFKSQSKRIDRGVRQAGFLVLKESAMPSILVELGFISTPSEEKYLNTENGTASMANSIFRAFLNYKRAHEIRLNGSSQTVIPATETPQEKPSETTTQAKPQEPRPQTPARESQPQAEQKPAPAQDASATGVPTVPIFKIQITTSSRPLRKGGPRFKGLKGVDCYQEGGLYKYTYGSDTDYNQIYRLRRTITSKFKDCFIIAFKNGEKMDVNQAIREFKARR